MSVGKNIMLKKGKAVGKNIKWGKGEENKDFEKWGWGRISRCRELYIPLKNDYFRDSTSMWDRIVAASTCGYRR